MPVVKPHIFSSSRPIPFSECRVNSFVLAAEIISSLAGSTSSKTGFLFFWPKEKGELGTFSSDSCNEINVDCKLTSDSSWSEPLVSISPGGHILHFPCQRPEWRWQNFGVILSCQMSCLELSYLASWQPVAQDISWCLNVHCLKENLMVKTIKWHVFEQLLCCWDLWFHGINGGYCCSIIWPQDYCLTLKVPCP